MDEWTATEASKSGDRKAFGLLVDQYYRNIYRFAFHYTGNHQDADDICQETFVRALSHIEHLKDGGHFKGWIFTIAANLLRKQGRTSQRAKACQAGDHLDETLEGMGDRPFERISRQEQADMIRQELQRMPGEVRLAAVLTLMEGYSQREVARIARCSEATVSRHVETARGLLRARLRPLID